ncbi:MAG: hypothetical protein EXR69_08405 [Myxococcales bacterium]|nr:hypothetical protein [Myxococcales bacterium]
METGPDDLAVLGAFLTKLLATMGGEETIQTVLALVARLMRNEAKLTGKLKALLRGHAGGGTEQFGSKQLQLWKEALDEAVAADGDEESVLAPEPKPKAKPKRLALPASLPHRKVELTVEPHLRICALCGANKVCIGHETSQVLELHPARFEVSVYEREKLACPERCAESVDVHTPINRVLGIYRRLGVDLPEGTVYG